MIDYKIVYSPEANTDIEELLNVITNKFSAPIAAFNYAPHTNILSINLEFNNRATAI